MVSHYHGLSDPRELLFKYCQERTPLIGPQEKISELKESHSSKSVTICTLDVYADGIERMWPIHSRGLNIDKKRAISQAYKIALVMLKHGVGVDIPLPDDLTRLLSNPTSFILGQAVEVISSDIPPSDSPSLFVMVQATCGVMCNAYKALRSLTR